MLDPSLWPEWAIEPLISPSQRARAKCLLDQDPLGLARVIRPWINRVEIGTQIARQLQSDRRAMHDGLTTVLNVAVASKRSTLESQKAGQDTDLTRLVHSPQLKKPHKATSETWCY